MTFEEWENRIMPSAIHHPDMDEEVSMLLDWREDRKALIAERDRYKAALVKLCQAAKDECSWEAYDAIVKEAENGKPI